MRTLIVLFLLTFQTITQIFAQVAIHAGTYSITNKNSNLCLAIRGATGNNGEEATQWTCDGNADKNWGIIDAGGGYYKLQNKNSNLFLAIGGGIRDNGGRCIQYADEGQQDILWRFIDIGAGYFKIQNKNSGLFLAVGGGSREPGAEMIQWVDAGQEDIKWKLGGIMTHFDPVSHGFKFANNFENNRFVGPIFLSFGGRCAGMIYAALDYYRNNIQIPQQTELPVEGSVLSTYISARQEVANNSYNEKYTELNFNFGGIRTAEFFNWGVQGFGGGRLQELRELIDAGHPCPITLYNPTGNLAEYPHHVVLAIGYEMGRYTGDLGNYKDDLKIYVYDPNYPGEIKTLRPYSADFRYGYTDEPNSKPWLTYFLHKNYRASIPPGQPTGCPSARLDISNQSFRGQNLSNRDFRCVLANRTDFYGCTINQGDFESGELKNAVFYGANLRNSNFQNTNIEGGNFQGADLKDTRFNFCNISGGLFYRADIKIAKLNTASLISCNFDGADMQNVEMAGTNCSGSRFVRTDLKNSNCQNAIFTGTNLTGADFRNANLKGADFTGAIITGIQLQGAILTDTRGLNR